MGQGFTVNTASLAIRIGELNSVVAAVETAAGYLDSFGGDLGPGNLNAAVQNAADQWREGLSKMTEKIDKMAENVRKAVDNYEKFEFDSENRFAAKVDHDLEAEAARQLRQAQRDARAAEEAAHIPEGKI